MRKTLYAKEKRTVIEYNGNWEATPKESKAIKGFVISIFVSIAVLVLSLLLHIRILSFIMLAVLLLLIAGVVIFIIVTISKKKKEKPMEKYAYKIDYEYNGITDEVIDNSREIDTTGKTTKEILFEKDTDKK